MNQQTSQKIIEQAARGDQAAFRQLVLEHSRRVYQLAYRLTMDEAAAEDVAQETFIKVYRKLPGFKQASSLRTWLHRITVNTAMDYLRRRSRQEVSLAPDDLPPAVEADAALCALEQHEVRERTASLLRQLSPMERSALSLRHFEGYSIREICAALHIGESACKQAIFRAVKKLRVALEPWS